jgi:hypothetical protein
MRAIWIVVLSTALAGCASSSADITPAYVSPVAYQAYTFQARHFVNTLRSLGVRTMPDPNRQEARHRHQRRAAGFLCSMSAKSAMEEPAIRRFEFERIGLDTLPGSGWLSSRAASTTGLIREWGGRSPFRLD